MSRTLFKASNMPQATWSTAIDNTGYVCGYAFDFLGNTPNRPLYIQIIAIGY